MPLGPFDPATLAAYCAAAVALVLAPGPAQALVLTRTLESGWRAGVLTSLGLNVGTLVHTAGAALGLSAVLATSATAFAAVKYAGATYLVVLGVLAIRRSALASAGDNSTSAGPADSASGTRPVGPRASRLLLHGAVVGILNPKVALFFLAFLPQFVRPERGAVLAQFAALGLILAVLGVAWDVVLAGAAGKARGRLLVSRRFAAWRERMIGAVLIALGLRLALADRR